MTETNTPQPQEQDDLIAIRQEKLRKLRDSGVDPYPAKSTRTHTTQEALELGEKTLAGDAVHSSEPTDSSIESAHISVAGRIVSRRIIGKASFCHIQDGSGKIQLYFKRDIIGEEPYATFRELIDIGDFVGATGKLFRTRSGEITLEVASFSILSKTLRPLPEKWHGLQDVEARFRQRYLDLITNEEARQIFRARSRIVTAIRRFLDDRGFVEVETPVLQPIYGGTTARPFKTFYKALDREFYLRIATELYLKRLVVGGMDKVYEIGRVFRNEGLDFKHNPEFTLLETYEAYTDYQGVMAMVEEMIPYVAEYALGARIIGEGDRRIDLSPPWRRVTLRDVILEHSGVDFTEFPDARSLYERVKGLGLPLAPTSPRGKIIDELLSTFAEPKLFQPTFVVDYPVELSPLAKKRTDDPTLVERFEAFAGGFEIANAFSELNDPNDQRDRFLGQLEALAAGDEEAHLMDEDYILALEHGLPPTGGLGIGIDRLVMFLTGQHSLRETILFPQLRTPRS